MTDGEDAAVTDEVAQRRALRERAAAKVLEDEQREKVQLDKEEAALDRLEERQLLSEKRQRREALRPHVKDEIARFEDEKESQAKADPSETAAEREARYERERGSYLGETVAEREARYQRERGS